MRKIDLGAAVLLVVGLLVAFSGPLAAMVATWNTSPMYSYAYTVPPISLYLIWARRQVLRATAICPARCTGAVVILGSLVMLAAGDLGGVLLLQQLAFIVASAGLVIFLFGWRHAALAAPALSYLLFMVPLWDLFTERLHQPFQINSAQLGVGLMRAIGVPAYRDGVMIALPNVLLEVARACSGVNYLVAVVALALPLALLRLGTWGRRVALVAGSLVIAALANGVRVALIGTLAYYEVGSPLHGPFHMLHGLFVAGVGYAALFAGLHLLEPRATSAALTSVEAPSAAAAGRWRLVDVSVAAALLWAVAVIGVTPAPRTSSSLPLARLDTQLGQWYAEPVRVQPQGAALPWRDADDRLSRRYRSMTGQVAIVDVWYFATQRQNHEAVSFATADLHRVANSVEIPLPQGGRLTANALSWPDRREVGVFWYEIGGVAESNPIAARVRAVWRGLSGRRDGAAVLLRGTARPGDEGLVSAQLRELAAHLYSALAAHWRTSPQV